MCLRFLLNIVKEYTIILRIFTINSARECFQYVLYENTTFSDTIYVIIMTKYTPECTKLQHLKLFSLCSMLALAFSPHRGLKVKESNTLVFGQSNFVLDLVRSIINFSKWRIILKLR